MSPSVTGRVGRGNPADAPVASPAAIALANSVTTTAIQDRAAVILNRPLSAEELAWVVERFFVALDETLDMLIGSRPKAPAGDELDKLLLSRGQIAHVWSVEDVLEVRPDLTEGEAWFVLQLVDDQKDASLGITWDTLTDAASQLFPEEGGAA